MSKGRRYNWRELSFQWHATTLARCSLQLIMGLTHNLIANQCIDIFTKDCYVLLCLSLLKNVPLLSSSILWVILFIIGSPWIVRERLWKGVIFICSHSLQECFWGVYSVNCEFIFWELHGTFSYLKLWLVSDAMGICAYHSTMTSSTFHCWNFILFWRFHDKKNYFSIFKIFFNFLHKML